MSITCQWMRRKVLTGTASLEALYPGMQLVFRLNDAAQR